MNAAAEIGLLEDEDIDLVHAALHLAALDHPERDLQNYLDNFESWAEQLLNFGHAATDPVTQARALALLLGTQEGLAGDVDHYDAPENANLMDVLDRRRGQPVALSILYAGLAWRLGWSADILNVPGHVLARIGTAQAGVLIDPFGGGRILEGEDVRLLLSAMGSPVGTDMDFAPLSHRATLVRLLSNEASRAAASGQAQRALELYVRMTALAPGFSALWWERARLEQMQGLRRQARASLVAMIETTREPRLLARVHATLDALARTIN